jgi:hypothetical protein
MHLTVIHPFGDYVRGDKIRDEEKIAAVLEGENKHHIVRTADPEDGMNGSHQSH